MNIYVWRHNKTYHSHSMIDEPCVNSEFYLDAVAVVLAQQPQPVGLAGAVAQPQQQPPPVVAQPLQQQLQLAAAERLHQPECLGKQFLVTY